jgi:hypothetical protein
MPISSMTERRQPFHLSRSRAGDLRTRKPDDPPEIVRSDYQGVPDTHR